MERVATSTLATLESNAVSACANKLDDALLYVSPTLLSFIDNFISITALSSTPTDPQYITAVGVTPAGTDHVPSLLSLASFHVLPPA